MYLAHEIKKLKKAGQKVKAVAVKHKMGGPRLERFTLADGSFHFEKNGKTVTEQQAGWDKI